jgi:hypothetical protein
MDAPINGDIAVNGTPLESKGFEAKPLETLAGNLVWRIGRLSDDAPLTVRIGLASSIKLFNDLPKLRSANDNEIESAMKEKNFRIEWVGRVP